MTRKDYVKFAAMIKRLRELAPKYDHIHAETLEIVQVELSRIFEADNRRFKADKFFKACRPVINHETA